MTCQYPHQSGHLVLVMSGKIARPIPTALRAYPQKVDVFKQGHLAQTLIFAGDDDADVNPDGLQNDEFTSIDLDFDGFDDLQIWSSTSAGPNDGYSYWLYNPASASFERRQDLDVDLSGMSITTDPQTKTVNVSGRGSCCDVVMDQYHWVAGKLVLMEETDTGSGWTEKHLEDVPGIVGFVSANGGFCGTTTYKYNDAKLVTSIRIETQGDPCDDKMDFRASVPATKTPDGTIIRGNIVDEYGNGLLLARTITFNPPRKKEDIQ